MVGGQADTKERNEVGQRSLFGLGPAFQLRQEARGKEIKQEAVFLKLNEDF